MAKSQPSQDKLAKLLLQAKDGVPGAFERVHSAIRKDLENFVAGSAGRIGFHQREDIVQEVFLRTWHNLPDYQDISSARTYLFGIARNIIRENQRRRYKDPLTRARSYDIFDEDEEEDASLPAKPIDPLRAELTVIVEEAIARLTPIQRQAIDLVYLRGLPYPQAAKLADCSTIQLRSRLFRAYRRLGKLLYRYVAP